MKEMVKHLSSSLAAARSRSMRAFTAVSLEETWSTERESVRIGGDGSGGDDQYDDRSLLMALLHGAP